MIRAQSGLIKPFQFNDTSNLEAIQQSYRENGFFILEKALENKKLANLRETITRLFKIHAKNNEDVFQTCSRLDAEDRGLLYRIYQCVQKCVAIEDLKLSCLSFAKKLHPDSTYVAFENSVLFGLPNDKRLRYRWHQESNYMPGINNLVNFWFPVFEPASKQNGAMSFLIRSHKLGTLPYTKESTSNQPNSYTNLLPKNIEAIEKECEEFHCVTEVGDLVIFDKDLMHQSNPNTTSRTRFSGVIRIAALNYIPERLSFSNDLY